MKTRMIAIAIAMAIALFATTVSITNQSKVQPPPTGPSVLYTNSSGNIQSALIGANLNTTGSGSTLTLNAVAATSSTNITKTFVTATATTGQTFSVTGFPCADLEVARNGLLNYAQNNDFTVAADGSSITYPSTTPIAVGDFIAIRCYH